MDWLALLFALELGAIRGSDISVDAASYVQTDFAVVLLEHLEIGGKLRSYQIPDENYWWAFRMDYTIAATIRFGALSIGVEHLCYHPVVPFKEYRVDPVDGWSERAFVRIATEHTIW